MLPVITNTLDNPATTADDSSNLVQSSVYPCVSFTADVRGPGFTTGDVTWSVLNSSNTVVTGVISSGQNTVQATFNFDDAVPAGQYTIKACLTSNLTDCSTHTITLLPLPAITVGTPNQAHVGGRTQFNTNYPFAVIWTPAEVASTGLASWTTAGVKTVTYTVGTCTSTLSYTVYSALSVAEYTAPTPLYLSAGQSLPLTVTGGSGSYSYTVTGQNTISSTGILKAGIYGGEYTVTIIDNLAGIIYNIPLGIGSQAQFCVAVEETVCQEQQADACCEIQVDCGDTITLKVPTFHQRVNGLQQEIKYLDAGSGTTGDAGYLKSGTTVTDAKANTVDCNSNESLFEIITSLDMADTANAPFGIGYSAADGGNGVDSIDIAVVWFTSAGSRYVEIRQNGVPVADSRVTIFHGDSVSAGYKNGIFVLYVNNLLKTELPGVSCCGNQFIDISIEQANKSIGGNLTGLTWTITTAGSPSEVGIINESGMYATPVNATFSLVQAEATVGSSRFRVNIRNVKPTLKYTDPKSFLAGKAVTIWVGPYIPGFNEVVRLAKNGSPDSLQNTYKGIPMIDLGTLEGSANFQVTRDYQDFENDLGEIYHTAVTKESATLAATFLEVRNQAKMSRLVSGSRVSAKINGTTEFSVGGDNCDIKELRVIMVIGQANCGDQFDVLYLPRVQNKGNLGLEVGRKTTGKYDMTLTALPDFTRSPGKQLFSIFQIDSCSAGTCA